MNCTSTEGCRNTMGAMERCPTRYHITQPASCFPTPPRARELPQKQTPSVHLLLCRHLLRLLYPQLLKLLQINLDVGAYFRLPADRSAARPTKTQQQQRQQRQRPGKRYMPRKVGTGQDRSCNMQDATPGSLAHLATTTSSCALINSLVPTMHALTAETRVDVAAGPGPQNVISVPHSVRQIQVCKQLTGY